MALASQLQNSSANVLESGGMGTTSGAMGNPKPAGGESKDPWLKLAQDAYSRSTNYIDTNYRKGWEDNLRMFQSKHPKDSKYQSDAYKYRSRIFRPKSRSVLRKNEATAALAFFSNPDVVSIDPIDQDNKEDVASSIVMQELLQYRLTKTIPWFLTLLGGFQDAMAVGLVASLQVWRYRAKTTQKKVTGMAIADDGTKNEISINMPHTEIIEDQPSVDLFPIENIRFDPAAHWYDVVATSPYIILQIPMYINDVLDNMESDDKHGNSWNHVGMQTLLNSRVKGFDPIRQARNDNREDPEAITSQVNEFDVVMVHLNFIKSGDTTYTYYTLEDKQLLSKPIPVAEAFLHCKDGRPPVQIGFCVIETHKPVPTSLIGLTSELQREANEIVNQRLDNVKYVLNKRSIVRRGSNVDIESLLRNVPGGVTMANDVEKDIREVNWPDVTSSSYQEQTVLNSDFDDLAGNFAQGSVDTNRRLNETVGGMKIMAQGANMLTEYTIRILVETWVEPVLRQLMKMEQAYETDETILAVAGKRGKLMQKFGMNQVTDSLLNRELTLSVNIGMGATDPEARLKAFMTAMQLYQGMATQGSPDMDLPEIRKYLFGLAGVKTASRFFTEVNPQVHKALQAAQQAEQQAQQIVQKGKEALVQKQIALDKREAQLNLEELQIKYEMGGEAAQAMQDMAIRAKQHAQEQRLALESHAFKMSQAHDKSQQQLFLKQEKAREEAAIKRFNADLDAELKKFMANLDAALTIKKANAEAKAIATTAAAKPASETA